MRSDRPADHQTRFPMILFRIQNVERNPGGPEIPEAQRRVEAIEGARRYMAALDRYGGVRALVEAVNDYRRHDPQRSELLKRIGMAGMPGAKSLEALAGEYHISRSTLTIWQKEIIKDIAYIVVYSGENFELAG